MKQNLRAFDEEMLNSTSQAAIAGLVSGLPSESPSMLWRSGLNEAIRLEASRNKRKRRLFWMIPTAGVSLATAMAAFVFVIPSMSAMHGLPAAAQISQPDSKGSLEASLIDIHQTDVRVSDVSGSGLNPAEATEAAQVPSGSASPTDDSESDLEL